MVDGWYTKTETRSTGSTAGTYDTYFFHPSGKRFRSRAEIARYFELQAAPAPRRSADAPARADAKAALKLETVEARSAEAAERDAQRQKEIEYARRYPCADALLADDDVPEPPLGARLPPAPLPAGVDGVPSAVVGDLLQCWHGERRPRPRGGLARAGSRRRGAADRPGAWRATSTRGATTSRTRCATSASFSSVAVHDTGAARWWPSLRLVAGATAAAAAAAAGAGGARRGRKPGLDVATKPLIKIDLPAILASTEEGASVRRWVTVLEGVHAMRTNTGNPIKEAVELAMVVAKEPEVKRYLGRALKHYKGNAAGTTKHAALWLAAQMRQGRPEAFSGAQEAGKSQEAEVAAAAAEAAALAPTDLARQASALVDDEEEVTAEEQRAAVEAAAAALAAAEGEGEGEEAGEGEGEGEEAEGDVSYAAAAAAARAEADAKALAAGAAPGEEAEAEGADDDGDMMVAEVGEVVGGDQVDRRLLTGAAQEGWSMQPSGRGGRRREAAAWSFVGPSGVLYADKAEASSKRAQESADAAAAAKSSLQNLPPVAENPTELPGCRISTFWEDEDGGGGGTWYGAQVMSYDAAKDTFECCTTTARGGCRPRRSGLLLYRMTPPALAAAGRARRSRTSPPSTGRSSSPPPPSASSRRARPPALRRARDGRARRRRDGGHAAAAAPAADTGRRRRLGRRRLGRRPLPHGEGRPRRRRPRRKRRRRRRRRRRGLRRRRRRRRRRGARRWLPCSAP